MNIAVFMGGSSTEREVSLSSGAAITKALQASGHTVTEYDVQWSDANRNIFTVIDEISRNDTDIVFLAFHGGLGENGGIQGVLDAAGIPYTGSDITASAVAMDKNISKALFRHYNIPTANWIAGDASSLDIADVESEIGFPCVVKPSDQGSTVGLTVVKTADILREGIDKAAEVSSNIMIESYVTGKELSVPILGTQAMPVIEIQPSHDVYDYECKYTSGMSNYFVPAPIPESLRETVTEYALKVFNLLGLRDIARIDFRLNDFDVPLCFEANTLPGMTSTSLVPKSAAKAGIDFVQLVDRIAQSAYKRKGNV